MVTFQSLNDSSVPTSNPLEAALPQTTRELPARELPSRELATRELFSHELLCGQHEVIIRHGADAYRLSLTCNGKLILRK